MAWGHPSGRLTEGRSHQWLNLRLPAVLFKVSFAFRAVGTESSTGTSFIPTSLLPPLDLWATAGRDLWGFQILSWTWGREKIKLKWWEKSHVIFYCLFSVSFDNCPRLLYFVTTCTRVTGTCAECSCWYPEVQLCTAAAPASLPCTQGSHTN